jgi:MFS superfamily sulfate permease-like transporter
MSWLFASLGDYQRSWLRGDLVVGVTVWAVLVPEALAYASIAAMLGVMISDTLPGLLIGIASSILLLIYHVEMLEQLDRVYPTVQAAVDAAQRSSS